MDLNQTLGAIGQRLNLPFDISFAVALLGLILARTVPMVVLSPIWGGKLVTGQIKIGIAMVLVLTLYPGLYPTLEGKIPLQGLSYWGLIFKEVGLGAMIGFVSSLVFHAMESAGHLIDIQRGTAQASVLVPQLDIQGPVFSNFQIQLSILLFFMLNLHHVFLNGYYDSFMLIPLDQYPRLSQHFMTFIEQTIHMSSAIFSVAMQLAAPIVLAIFMVDVFLGVANRMAPQVQVYFLGMGIKAAVGIIMFMVSFTFITRYMGVLFIDMLRQLRILLGYLGPQ